MRRVAERPFSTVAIVGLGLIGSSIARAARHFGTADTVVAIDHDPAVCRRVEALGVADRVTADAAAGVAGADLVVLCVPVGAMGAVALFENRWCILTPPDGADPAPVARLAAMWRAFGSNVEVMAPSHHDLVLAITSHVPHLIAYNIVGTAAHLEAVTQSEVMKFSAGGFRDFTRIAASDPTMWRDVFLHNRDAVLEMLGRFNEDLAALQRLVRYGDGDGLFDLFTRTRAIRKGIIAQGQETPAADFGRRGDTRAATPQ